MMPSRPPGPLPLLPKRASQSLLQGDQPPVLSPDPQLAQSLLPALDPVLAPVPAPDPVPDPHPKIRIKSLQSFVHSLCRGQLNSLIGPCEGLSEQFFVLISVYLVVSRSICTVFALTGNLKYFIQGMALMKLAHDFDWCICLESGSPFRTCHSSIRQAPAI